MKRSRFRAPSTALATILFASSLFVAPTMAHSEDLPVGADAPNFTLPSQDNTPISLSQYKGKWVVLYFYPKDKTKGCTIEAHNFQTDLPKFKAANAVVLGVSLDTADSHKSFCTQESLTFKLLADPDHKVVDAYGVPVKNYGVMKFASRHTFLISPSGKIVKVWPDVDKDLNGQDQAILDAIGAAQ
jgi:peroxiredoxin Q/BCP